MNEQQIRQDQMNYARSQQRGGTEPNLRFNRAQTIKQIKQKPVAKGHEAFLKALEASNASIQVEKISSGEKIVGRVKTSDKFTISIAVPVSLDSTEYVTRVLFKHDISEFTPIPQPQQQSVEIH